MSVETGHRKRKNKIKREKIETKKTFRFGDSPDATPENYHDDNIRRKDLIEKNSLHRGYCTYTNEFNPQRDQQILAIHGQR